MTDELTIDYLARAAAEGREQAQKQSEVRPMFNSAFWSLPTSILQDIQSIRDLNELAAIALALSNAILRQERSAAQSISDGQFTYEQLIALNKAATLSHDLVKTLGHAFPRRLDVEFTTP